MVLIIASYESQIANKKLQTTSLRIQYNKKLNGHGAFIAGWN